MEPQLNKRTFNETAEFIISQPPLKKQKINQPEFTKDLFNQMEINSISPSEKIKIDSISAETLVTPTAPQKKTALKTANLITGRRQHLPTTAAPCFTQSLEHKAVGECDEESIREHAYLRIQVFSVLLVTFCGMARRSDPTKQRNLLLRIQAAYLQVGKATNFKEHKYDGSHFNAGSGLIDGIRDVLIEEISIDREITPLKKQFLLNKGFTEEIFAELARNGFTKESINEMFNRVWPVCKSILFNTETDQLINGTTELLKIINLTIDKALEKVLRPRMLELLEKIAKEELPPSTQPCSEFEPLINATKEFHKIIVDFFILFQKTINKLCQLLQQYDQEFQKLDDYTNLSKDTIVSLIKKLHVLEKQLCPQRKTTKNAKVAVNDAISQINESSVEHKNPSETSSEQEQPIKRIRMQKNHKFLNDTFREIYNNQFNSSYDPIPTLTRWWTKRATDLKNELIKQKMNLEAISKYVSLELEGSQLPLDKDYNFFKALFGKNESLVDIQKRLLKPIPIPQTTTTTPLPKRSILLRKTGQLNFNQTVLMIKV